LDQLGGRPFFTTLLSPNAVLDCLPKGLTTLLDYANTLGLDFAKCGVRVELLKGCSSASVSANQEVYRALIRTQVKAMCAAAVQQSAAGSATVLRPSIPIIGSNEKLDDIVALVSATVEHCLSAADRSLVDVQLGGVVMLPRTCFIAASVCHRDLSFFTFDTDCLSELIFGLVPSACCADRQMENKRHCLAMERDIYETLDASAVRPMISDASKRIKTANSGARLLSVGSQTADPSTVKFFDKLGFDGISCTNVTKIPVALLAASQTNIRKHWSNSGVVSSYDTHWPLFGV
jgi:pyruvate,orthophosphate dikinase